MHDGTDPGGESIRSFERSDICLLVHVVEGLLVLVSDLDAGLGRIDEVLDSLNGGGKDSGQANGDERGKIGGDGDGLLEQRVLNWQ